MRSVHKVQCDRMNFRTRKTCLKSSVGEVDSDLLESGPHGWYSKSVPVSMLLHVKWFLERQKSNQFDPLLAWKVVHAALNQLPQVMCNTGPTPALSSSISKSE